MYYRISKYDPRFRKNGVYTQNVWTSFSDIGSSFDGEILTTEQYIEVENRYLACVESVLQASYIPELKISRLENYNGLTSWKNGEKLAGDILKEFLRDGLREKCWARLSGGAVCLDFGFEFYLHVGCPLEWIQMENIVRAHGLFLEPWHAPEE
ncbi:MAG: hypothetical protein IJN53_04000 [Oscillospiraceae bacterium]|nr:hypothetical protein [Oscillospiraceae bacterium]